MPIILVCMPRGDITVIAGALRGTVDLTCAFIAGALRGNVDPTWAKVGLQPNNTMVAVSKITLRIEASCLGRTTIAYR
jgi:hypothetical protein